MPNWRRHVLEPTLTAVVVIALALAVSIGLIVVGGDFGYLLPAIIGTVGYGLVVGVAWVGFAAIFSWLLRRRPRWSIILAGGCASLLIAAMALAPVVVRLIATDGWSGGPPQFAIGLAIAAVSATTLVQTVVHLVLRARHRSEVAAELG